MGRTSQHQITICTTCKHKGTTCNPGYELISQLRAAIAAAGDSLSDEFEISGIACMAGCERPCTVAYHSTRKTTYLFGDIMPDSDIDDLVAFARRYAAPDDGWCSARERPGKLRNATLARIPAAMIKLDTSRVTLQ